jgi:hypothetical protein
MIFMLVIDLDNASTTKAFCEMSAPLSQKKAPSSLPGLSLRFT